MIEQVAVFVCISDRRERLRRETPPLVARRAVEEQRDLHVLERAAAGGGAVSGGAVYYGAIALRRLGVRVAVVTRLYPDDLPFLDELSQEGVQVFVTPAPATSGIANYYSSADMERRICKPLGFAGAFTFTMSAMPGTPSTNNS